MSDAACMVLAVWQAQRARSDYGVTGVRKSYN